jgi:hypothetical protein
MRHRSMHGHIRGTKGEAVVICRAGRRVPTVVKREKAVAHPLRQRRDLRPPFQIPNPALGDSLARYFRFYIVRESIFYPKK